ncbi:GH25 family lysozyme [Dictyobacter kobayashii]|uniref:HYR domain-containing protein n=1 Tax=Dictyobacter kobayashii TaxID=2014872 RepID=A0A402AKY7_9CHLR|nr:GH25 family lysozyme [Dictyobacter kobayashii]GCE19719.1 hypothetical protein KDK_35190 [Dictyobacter kobayashii]
MSQVQGTIDWTQVAQAGKSFGYAKATEGTTFIDPTFQTNFAAMKVAGVKRGAYLFFHPGEDPTAQANFFLSILMQNGFTAGDLIPAIDVEVADGVPPSTVVSSLQTAVHTIQAALGVSPVILTNTGFWEGIGAPTAFSGNPLWIAQFGVPCPNIPSTWSTWGLWLYSDSGSVPGIAGSADLDQSNGPTLPIYADTTPPVLILPQTITTDATSPAGAVVTYQVSATDPDNPPAQLSIQCAPPSGSTFPIGTTTVNCTASDPAGNTTAGSFQVVVKGAAEQISDLITLVNSFHLSMGLQTSLNAKLTAALSAVNAGNIPAACGSLTAFINQVNAQSGKKLTPRQATQLRMAAQQIKVVLACSQWGCKRHQVECRPRSCGWRHNKSRLS